MTQPDDDGAAWDQLAERAVLGACLQAPRVIDRLTKILTVEDFFHWAHQDVFAAILDLTAGGKPADAVTVRAHLQARKLLAKMGGQAFLLGLVDDAVTAANVTHYAELVADTAIRRRLSDAALTVRQLATKEATGDELSDLVEQARAVVDQVATKHRARTGTDDGEWIGPILDQALERYARPMPAVTPTGFYDLDFMLEGGLRPGSLTVVAARTSVGKSTIALNVAVKVAEAHTGVLFASLEMPREELANRILAAVANVPQAALLRHRLEPHDWDKLRAARERLADVPLRVVDTPSLSLARLASQARDLTRHHAGLGLVVADYLQLMRPADPRIPREQQVSAISSGLKRLAMELHVPVIAVAQLNRGPEQRQTKRPYLSDLRESGAIENDSDVVMLLWQSDEAREQNLMSVLVEKNRHGAKGEVELYWSPNYARADSVQTGKF